MIRPTPPVPAGTQLRVRDVAAKMGTGETPVPETIRRLEETGPAVREPHKGSVALGVTPQVLIHVHDPRLLLDTEDCRVLDALDHDEALLTTLYTRSRIETMLDQEPAVP